MITTIPKARDPRNIEWDELLSILRVHEVHLQNRERLQKKNSIAFKYVETSFKRVLGLDGHFSHLSWILMNNSKYKLLIF